MAKQFTTLAEPHRRFIERQHIFFVASAAGDSHVNVSPRSTDCLRLIGGNTAAYLDLTGSGNETAAHIRAGGRVTMMFCAFEGPPMILRLFGPATVHRRGSPDFAALHDTHFAGVRLPGERQIVTLDADLIQSSCGYRVPFFAFEGERGTLDEWAARRDEAEMEAYWRQKNMRSIDGLPTGLLDEEPV